jgi:hypothetical protein
VQFFQLALNVAGDGRVANVGVDLARSGNADAHRLKHAGQMDAVGGDHHAAARHFRTNQFWFELFALGTKFHLGGNDARARLFKLRHGRADLQKQKKDRTGDPMGVVETGAMGPTRPKNWPENPTPPQQSC